MLKKPLAFLARTLGGQAAASLFSGIVAEAKIKDVPLLVVLGGQLETGDTSVIYKLLDQRSLSGILTWASSDIDSRIRFYDNFTEIPLVSLSLELPGHPVVFADSYQGMLDAVEHLITVHGRRRIAFVRGPASHVYAQERHQAWKDALLRHRLGISLETEAPDSWNKIEGRRAVDHFLDKLDLRPGSDIDAIACVNDNMALGVLEALQERGIRVPEDIAIIGYNDSKEARYANPPLSSVAMPFEQQGATALTLLLKAIDGETVPAQTKLPATFVQGLSCGCESQGIARALLSDQIVDLASSNTGTRVRSRKLWKQGAEQLVFDSERQTQLARELAEVTPGLGAGRTLPALIKAFWGDVEAGNSQHFLPALAQCIRAAAEQKTAGNEVFQNLVSSLRFKLRPYLMEPQQLSRAESLWSAARVFISETILRQNEAQRLKLAAADSNMQEVGAQLISSYRLDKIYSILATYLPKLGIARHFVVLYEDGDKNAGSAIPKSAKLVASSEQSSLVGTVFESWKILPEQIGLAGGTAFVLFPLCFDKIQFGYVLLETGSNVGDVYATLQIQLSSAIYGCFLIQENAAVRDSLRQTLEAMEQEVSVVTQHSGTINEGVQSGSSAMEQVAANIREIARTVEEVKSRAASAAEISGTANNQIQELSRQSEQIDSVVQLISDIAERTKILSFNAAVEAARAGEAGRGFAVISKEVKELALSTVKSASDIATLIATIQASTKISAAGIAEARLGIAQVAELSAQITQAVDEQKQATSDLTRMLIDSAQGTQEIAQALERIKKIGIQFANPS